MNAYHRQLVLDTKKIFGYFRHGNLDHALIKLPELRLSDDEQQDVHAYHDRINIIFTHALQERGIRTRDLLKGLGWLDNHNQVNQNYLHLYKPTLLNAKQPVKRTIA